MGCEESHNRRPTPIAIESCRFGRHASAAGGICGGIGERPVTLSRAKTGGYMEYLVATRPTNKIKD
jgi:hypothetical protein